MKNYNLSLIASMAIAYCLILYIALKTPIHSDDFTYAMKGLSIKEHFHHYMIWSGRVVADYVSTFILGFKNHTLSAMINSLGSIILIYNIAKLPTALRYEISKSSLAINFIFLFLLYWVSNPNLGQVMFWIVGSANYMWTTMLIIFFIRKLIEYRETENDKNHQVALIFFYGLLAGMSNENTSVTTVALVLILSIYYKVTTSKFGQTILSGLLGSVVGTTIMVLAPGNFVRASGASLDTWRNTSLADKYIAFIYKTIPDVASHIWIALIMFSIVSLIVLIQGSTKKKFTIFSAFMLFAFFLANAVMIVSPGYPTRTMNGQFIFLLCALSFLLAHLKKNNHQYSKLFLIILLSLYFIPSYKAIAISYKAAYEQSKVRDGIILEAKNAGLKDVKIPGYYFYGFRNKGDVFDTYHTPYSGPYYGMRKIEMYPAGFDYSRVFKACKNPVNIKIYNDSYVKCIYSYKNNINNTITFVTEFSSKQNMNNDIRAFIKPIVNDNIYTNNTSFPIRTITIDKRFFSYFSINRIDGDYDRLVIGTYVVKTGKIINQVTIKQKGHLLH